MQNKDQKHPQSNSTGRILTDLHEIDLAAAGVVYEYDKDGLKNVPQSILTNPPQPSDKAVNSVKDELAAERVNLVQERKAAYDGGRNFHTKKKATFAGTVLRPADQTGQEDSNGSKSSFG